jgi:hypothetical protein
MAGGLAALVGLAGAANAAETLSMIWQESGLFNIFPNTSSTIHLDVVVNADAGGTGGGEISVDYTSGGAANKLTFVGCTENPDGLFNTPVPGRDCSTGDTGVAVLFIGQVDFGGAACAGGTQPCRLGTVAFHKNADPGGLVLQSYYDAGDGVITLFRQSDGSPGPCAVGTCGAGFGTATVNAPEPGALALLALGFGGLVLGRNRRS